MTSRAPRRHVIMRAAHDPSDEGIVDTFVGSRSAERERECFDTSVEEFDRERSIGDRSLLADQLIEALIDDGAVAVLVDIEAVRGTWRLPIDRDAKAHR